MTSEHFLSSCVQSGHSMSSTCPTTSSLTFRTPYVTLMPLNSTWIRTRWNANRCYCFEALGKIRHDKSGTFQCKFSIPTTYCLLMHTHAHTYITVLRPFFRDHPGEPVPEEIFWTFTVQGKITEADTLTIWVGTTPSGLISDPPSSSPHFYAGCPSCCNPPTLSWLWTGTKNAGLHIQWHGTVCS